MKIHLHNGKTVTANCRDISAELEVILARQISTCFMVVAVDTEHEFAAFNGRFRNGEKVDQ